MFRNNVIEILPVIIEIYLYKAVNILDQMCCTVGNFIQTYPVIVAE